MGKAGEAMTVVQWVASLNGWQMLFLAWGFLLVGVCVGFALAALLTANGHGELGSER